MIIVCHVGSNAIDSVLVEPNSRIGLDEVEVDFVAKEFSNVVHAIPADVSYVVCCVQVDLLDHCGPLQTQAPTVDSHVLGQSHGFQHLRSEHATVTNLDPLLETFVI